MTVRIVCRKTIVQSGSRRYPLFVGFAPASEVVKIADAPSFSGRTAHREIAVNVLEPPVKEWQRPLDQTRVADIRQAFRDEGSLMPNPVLLSANGEGQGSAVRLSQEMASGAIPTENWIVEIDVPAGREEKPLWILDGQHRIHGLAKSRQKANEIPIVLLLNDGSGDSYTGRDFANLFAQVTTTAKKLDDLHNEWLTFAYKLDSYSPTHTDHDEHIDAMKTVAELARRAEFDGQVNPFHNNVRFNPELQVAKRDGFVYTCVGLKELVRRNYFAQATAVERVTPEALAKELALAHNALKRVVTGPQEETVFFGAGDFGHVAMQDAFLIGVMSYVREHGVNDDWEGLLRGLAFSTTDWRFKRWVVTTGGKAGTDSRNIAQRMMSDIFKNAGFPAGVDDIADYLGGNRAEVDFVFSNLNDTGKPRAAGRIVKNVIKGDRKSADLEGRRHIKIDPKWKRTNIARLEVIDSTSSVANPKKYPEILARGLTLDAEPEPAELQLTVHMIFYGGLSSDATVTIRAN